MRLAAIRDAGRERLVVVRDKRCLPADELLAGGPATIAALFEGGDAALARLRVAAAAGAARIDGEGRPIGSLELLAPVPRPGKIVAIGLNYFEHAAEQGRQPPVEPMIFAKYPSAVVGPGAEVRWDPRLTAQVDYEVELAVVIGRRTRRVERSAALAAVLGYTVANDVSARDLQARDRQFTRAKSLDTFAPLGPVLVTADEVPDPQALRLTTTVNGELLQDGSTADMIFGVAELIEVAAAAFTLEPGDVILTGTPSGVGVYRRPPRFLHHGDLVTVAIEGLGALTNRCVEEWLA